MIRLIAAALASVALAATPVGAQHPARQRPSHQRLSHQRPELPRAARTLRDSLVDASIDFFNATGTPGLAVGVWKDGHAVLARGFGVARAGVPGHVTPRTVFHTASISKTFVAVAIMQLVEQGKVALDAPVTAYVRDFALNDARTPEVTIRRLLNHTAGMPDVTEYAWDTPNYDDDALARWVRSLRDSSLIAAPGAKWEYSNIGFEVLAHVVATVSGETFEGYITRHILAPVGMRHSTLLMTDVDSAYLAYGHEANPTGRRRAYPYNRRHAGSSTMHADVNDLMRYGAALATRSSRLLTPASFEAMWTPQVDITSSFREDLGLYQSSSVTMGLGWFLLTVRGELVLSHDGADRGFRSALLVVPSRRIVVTVLVNSGAGAAPLAHRLLHQAW